MVRVISKGVLLATAACVIMVTGGAPRAAADAGGPGNGGALFTWLLIGGRVGVSYELAAPADFNSEIQAFFPSSSSYFPVYSSLALSVTERFPIGDSGFRLALTELPMVSGIDQNFAMPSFILLVGVQSAFGLEGGVGPAIEPFFSSGSIKAGPSLVYSLGWRFEAGRASIPVTLLVDPLPPNRHLRVSLVAGIDYGFAPTLPKPKKPPFNY